MIDFVLGLYRPAWEIISPVPPIMVVGVLFLLSLAIIDAVALYKILGWWESRKR